MSGNIPTITIFNGLPDEFREPLSRFAAYLTSALKKISKEDGEAFLRNLSAPPPQDNVYNINQSIQSPIPFFFDANGRLKTLFEEEIRNLRKAYRNKDNKEFCDILFKTLCLRVAGIDSGGVIAQKGAIDASLTNYLDGNSDFSSLDTPDDPNKRLFARYLAEIFSQVNDKEIGSVDMNKINRALNILTKRRVG